MRAIRRGVVEERVRELGIAALLMLLAAPLQAGPPAPSGESGASTSSLQRWLAQPGWTGDWRGARPWLDQRGVTLTTLYAADILGNPVGGMHQQVRYFHDIFVELELDLSRLAAVPGAQIVASMSARAGTSLSDQDIGNVFNVSQVCCDPGTRLVTLAWQQTLLEHRLSFRIGHLCTGDDFLTSPLYGLFVTSGIDSNPGSVAFNVPFFEYPDAAVGAMLELRPWHHTYLKLGAYNGALDNAGVRGANFSFDFDSILAVAEAGYHATLPLGAGALPGHYAVGGFHHSGRFKRFDAPPDSDLPSDAKHGNAGFYFLLDQMVYRERAGAPEGLTPFLALVFAPDQEISEFPFFFDAGLIYRGPLPSRPEDSALFGIVYGSFSPDLRASQRGSPSGQQDFEMVLEWSYIVQLGQWLQVQPDMQYVIKPGGTGKIPNALVLGAQIAVQF